LASVCKKKRIQRENSTAKVFIGYAKKNLGTQKNKSSAQILSQIFYSSVEINSTRIG
jgi:hypothetical protein